MKTLASVLAEELQVRHGRVETWAAHITAVYSDVRTVRTREELDALPNDTAIRDADGFLCECNRAEDSPAWWHGFEPHEPSTPALVLWLPGEGPGL